MSRHLADHRSPSQGGRMKHYLRIARTQSNSFWRGLHQQPKAREDGNRRMREYLRIQRGHLA